MEEVNDKWKREKNKVEKNCHIECDQPKHTEVLCTHNLYNDVKLGQQSYVYEDD